MQIVDKYFSFPEIQKIGIYSITNIENGKMYIGSSENVYKRMREQAKTIIKNNGLNSEMRKDIKDKNDLYKFKFEVLGTFENGEITDQTLREYETECIKQAAKLGMCYNMVFFAYSNNHERKDKTLYCNEIKTHRKDGLKDVSFSAISNFFSEIKERSAKQGKDYIDYIIESVLIRETLGDGSFENINQAYACLDYFDKYKGYQNFLRTGEKVPEEHIY